MENGHIIHQGRISAINHEFVQVTIESQSACASCHASGACTSADKSTRIMNIPRNATHSHLKEGDFVTVEGNFSSGLKAVLFAYVIPFILMLITLLVLSGFTNNLVAGLSALGITIPYYAIIYLNKKHFEKQFSFIIK